jgi:hypothetical protein
MKRDRIIAARQALLDRLPVTGELLRGSLIERILRHRRGCATCARGDGHPLAVLTVSYPGGRTRQISLRRAQVPEVRGWANYQQLKEGIEAICELNHDLLRSDNAAARLDGTKA